VLDVNIATKFVSRGEVRVHGLKVVDRSFGMRNIGRCAAYDFRYQIVEYRQRILDVIQRSSIRPANGVEVILRSGVPHVRNEEVAIGLLRLPHSRAQLVAFVNPRAQ
jgi:hypothetical protein